MPWKNVLPMEEKQRFVNLMESGHFAVSELCEEFGVSRKSGHKWLAEYGEASSRPSSSAVSVLLVFLLVNS